MQSHLKCVVFVVGSANSTGIQGSDYIAQTGLELTTL